MCVCASMYVSLENKSDQLIQFAACLLWVRMAFLFNTVSPNSYLLKIFEEYSTLKTPDINSFLKTKNSLFNPPTCFA